jgi:ubiquinone/menaquinone biosynthesis C-methylase UbiE
VIPENMEEIWESFSMQAENFENDNMSFSKKEYLDYTVKCMGLKETDIVLEAAAGTCACGRSIAPFVESVKCLDATEAMLDVARQRWLLIIGEKN